MGKTKGWKEAMKYRLTKRIEQQAAMNLRQRMTVLAAGSKAIQWNGWLAPSGIVKVKSWKEMRRISAEQNKELDARIRARLRSFSAGIC